MADVTNAAALGYQISLDRESTYKHNTSLLEPITNINVMQQNPT